jgi:hypothetical protein
VHAEVCAQALVLLLEIQEAPEELAQIGEWIVTCATSEEFLARVRALSA